MQKQKIRQILVDSVGEAESLIDMKQPNSVAGGIYVARAVLVGATALFDVGNQIVSELDSMGRALERIAQRMP